MFIIFPEMHIFKDSLINKNLYIYIPSTNRKQFKKKKYWSNITE